MSLEKMIQKTLLYLASPEALDSIEQDPYWPKWNSPWWHMSLLHELELAKKIPQVTLNKMVAKLKKHYLPFFPTKENELPGSIDPYRQIACLCAVGNMYKILFHAGIDVDAELPWMREWFFHYQLPDGGWNCDEAAYAKLQPKSSLVTTMACLEAVFFCRTNELSQAEKELLQRGADYLIKQKLFRRISTGEVIDPNWLEIRFPRFYEYDFLRGYYFLAKWAQYSGSSLPDALVDEVEDLVSQQMTEKGILLKRYNLFDNRSYNKGLAGKWEWGKATEFELMKAVSYEGCPCPVLTAKWHEVRQIHAKTKSPQ